MMDPGSLQTPTAPISYVVKEFFIIQKFGGKMKINRVPFHPKRSTRRKSRWWRAKYPRSLNGWGKWKNKRTRWSQLHRYRPSFVLSARRTRSASWTKHAAMSACVRSAYMLSTIKLVPSVTRKESTFVFTFLYESFIFYASLSFSIHWNGVLLGTLN